MRRRRVFSAASVHCEIRAIVSFVLLQSTFFSKWNYFRFHNEFSNYNRTCKKMNFYLMCFEQHFDKQIQSMTIKQFNWFVCHCNKYEKNVLTFNFDVLSDRRFENETSYSIDVLFSNDNKWSINNRWWKSNFCLISHRTKFQIEKKIFQIIISQIRSNQWFSLLKNTTSFSCNDRILRNTHHMCCRDIY